ncbi:MAG: TIGR01777 family oxidoreductase [Ignavibacterium sp.]|jgi:uncharacterized protein (TIGR01777 family)|nr:TIGR01777 family oxidoreductase [Ignavibacterium sp.]
MKRIVVTGATGLIGKKLVDSLIKMKYEVIAFSRNAEKAKLLLPDANKFVSWDYTKPNEWRSEIENSFAIIHLAGNNLFEKRWNEKFKSKILESRELSTRNLIEAVKSSTNKPGVFICASGIGIYGDRADELLKEESLNGNDFLADVCKVWENESRKVEEFGVRSVQIRTGLVLSTEDGALKQMLPAFKFFVGGPLGSGKQWSSWLHIDDIVKIYLYALEGNSISGPVNAVSPNPVTMWEFAKTLGKVLNRPSIFPVPKFVLKLVIGEAAEVVTASQKVVPDKLIKCGYKFKFDNIETALRDLLK